MEISESDDYRELAATFQVLEMARLNNVLKRHGVTAPSARRKIVEEYFFGQGVFFDDGWFWHERARRVSPRLALARRDGGGGVKELLLPAPALAFSHHVEARKAATWLFDAADENPNIKHGLFGD